MRLVILGILCLLPIASLAEYEQPSASVVFYKNRILDPNLSDTLLASVSSDTEVIFIERREIASLLGEQEFSQSGFSSRQGKHLALGRLAGVDFFVFVSWDTKRESLSLKIADSWTSRVVFQESGDLKDTNATQVIERSAELLRRGFQEGVLSVQKKLPVLGRETSLSATSKINTFVLLRPELQDEQRDLSFQSDIFFEDLSRLLLQSGYQVLEREYAKDLAIESFWAEKGLTENTKNLPFLGGRYLITAKLSDQKGIELKLVDTFSGKRLGTRELELSEKAEEKAFRWLEKLVRTEPVSSRQAGIPESVNTLQPETLSSYYHGLLFAARGRYLDAIEHFENAYQSDTRFLEALDWVQFGYDKAGFSEVSSWIDRCYLKKASRFVGAGNPKQLKAAEGFNLIGVGHDTPEQSALASRISIQLVDALAQASKEPVFLSEDLAYLKEEYDLLLGLERVQGATWKRAPAVLFKHTLSGRVVSEKGQLLLHLFLVSDFQATSYRSHDFVLDKDDSNWGEQLKNEIFKLLESKVLRAEQELVIDQTKDELIQDIEKELRAHRQYLSRDVPFLKLLSLVPSQLKYLPLYPRRSFSLDYRRCLSFGLHHALLKKLSDEEPLKPWLDIRLAELYRLNTLANLSNEQGYQQMLEQIVKKYPRHAVARLAQINLALLTMKPDTYSETQTQLDLAKKELTRLAPDLLSDEVGAMLSKWQDILSIAQGKQIDLKDDLELSGLLAVAQAAPRAGMKARFYPYVTQLSPLAFFQQPESLSLSNVQRREQLLTELQLYPYLIQNRSAVSVMQEMIRKNPVSDVALKYVHGVLSSLYQNYDDKITVRDLVNLFVDYAKALTQVFQRDNIGYDINGLFALISPVRAPNTVHWKSLLESRSFLHARRNLEAEVVKALKEKRVFDELASDVLALCFLQYRTQDFPVSFEKECDAILAERVQANLTECAIESAAWRNLAEWEDRKRTKSQMLEVYTPEFKSCRNFYKKHRKTARAMERYFHFGLVFFQGGNYRLAETVFSELTNWRDENGESPDARLKANALYLLSLSELRNNNLPKALALAKKSSELSAGTRYRLVDGRNEALLESLVTDHLSQLRLGANVRFKNPYGDINAY